MSNAVTVGTDLPNLSGVNEEDVKAVGSSLPGKLLNSSAALLSLTLLVLYFAAKDATALKDFLGPELSSSPWLHYGLIFGFLSLVLVAVVQVLIEWRTKRRRRALQAFAVRTGYEQSGYFRIGPYLNTSKYRDQPAGQTERTKRCWNIE